MALSKAEAIHEAKKLILLRLRDHKAAIEKDNRLPRHMRSPKLLARQFLQVTLEELVDRGYIDDPMFQPFVEEFGRPLPKAEREEKWRKEKEAFRENIEILLGGPADLNPEQSAYIKELEALTRTRKTLRGEIERNLIPSRDELLLAATELNVVGKRLFAAIPRALGLKLRHHALVKELAEEYGIELA